MFYADGSILEGGGASDELVTLTFTLPRRWLDAPNDGLQATIQEDKYVCRKVQMGRANFIMLPQEYGGGNTIYQPENDDLGVYVRTWLRGMVKYGQIIGDDAYHDMRARVKAYTGIPRDCDR